MNLRRKLYWIFGLYIAEGFPFGSAYDVWQVYFRDHGVSLREIGLMSLLFVPYTLKPAWAPLVDRLGNRQHWIFGAQLTMAALTVALAFRDPSQTGWVMWGILLAFTVTSATQDVAIDAYAVDVSTAEHSGAINGVRVSAYRIAIVAAAITTALAGWIGWRSAWLAVAGFHVFLAFLTWASPRVERRAPAPPSTATPGLWRLRGLLVVLTFGAVFLAWQNDWSRTLIVIAALIGTGTVVSFLDPALLSWIGRRKMLALVFFVVLFKVGDSSLGRMVRPFWVDSGLSLEEIGLVSIGGGVVLTILGALAGGWFTSRRGIFAGLVVTGILQALSNFGYVAVAALQLDKSNVLLSVPYVGNLSSFQASIYSASIFESFCQGAGTAAFLALLTHLCDRERAATQFAVLTALPALARDGVGALSGYGAEAFGYSQYFAFTALLALPALALLPAVRKRLIERDAQLREAPG